MAFLTLHIAQGDADVARLRGYGFEHILPWREALADGPVRQRVDELFNTRRQFVTTAYSSSSNEYETSVVSIFHQITHGQWNQIVLHFDSDLFCCVNFMFLVSTLSSVDRLVWDVRSSQIELGVIDRAFISSCWRVYAGTDPTSIEDLLRQAPPRLLILARALEAHVRRFPNVRTGLGRPQEILEELIARGLTEDEDLVQAFITLDNNTYGWGNVQILRELRSLRALQRGSPLPVYLGGTSQITTGPHWKWDPLKKRLVWWDE